MSEVSAHCAGHCGESRPPAATTRAAAPSAVSGHCGESRAPSGDHARRSPFCSLWILRREPGPQRRYTRNSAACDLRSDTQVSVCLAVLEHIFQMACVLLCHALAVRGRGHLFSVRFEFLARCALRVMTLSSDFQSLGPLQVIVGDESGIRMLAALQKLLRNPASLPR